MPCPLPPVVTWRAHGDLLFANWLNYCVYQETPYDLHQLTVREQRADNVHIRDGVGEAAFVAMRHARDATLAAPRLIYPSLQVNIRGGVLPARSPGGQRFLKIPMSGTDGLE